MRPPHSQQVEDHAQRPHVRLRRVPLHRDHLWCYAVIADLERCTDVVQRSARIVQLLLRKDQLAESEVADLHVVQIRVAENVLGLRVRSWRTSNLDVAVDDAHAVQVCQALRKRTDNAVGLLFLQNRPSADIIVQLAAAQKLRHNVHLLRCHRPSTATSLVSKVSMSFTMFLCCTRDRIATSV